MVNAAVLPAHGEGRVVVAGRRVGQGKVHIALQLIVKLILVQQSGQEVRGESNQESLHEGETRVKYRTGRDRTR